MSDESVERGQQQVKVGYVFNEGLAFGCSIMSAAFGELLAAAFFTAVGLLAHKGATGSFMPGFWRTA